MFKQYLVHFYDVFKQYLGYFYDVYKSPVWLFVVAIGLFMIFVDSPKLLRKSKDDAMLIKIIGWVYLIGSSVVYIGIRIVR